MKRLIPIFLLVLIFAGTAAGEGFFKFHSLRLQFTANYDDNILRYSDRDLDRFEQSSEYYPSMLSSYDDWKNEFRLKTYFRGPRLFGSRMRLYYFAKFAAYYRNPFKNYHNHTLYINQKLGKKLEAHFKYFYMPKFYLREYRDRDLDRYESCDFENHQVRPAITYTILKKTDVTIRIEYEQIYYNKYFTEYDSESWLYEGLLTQKMGRNLTLGLSYGFKVSDNAGYTSLLSTPGSAPEEDSEYGESSYEADIYQFDARYRLRKLWGEDSDISLQYKLRRRCYSTDNTVEDDPFHAGRVDFRHRITASITRDILPLLEMELGYIHEWRDTDSPAPLVKEIKNFRQNVLAFSLTYKFF